MDPKSAIATILAFLFFSQQGHLSVIKDRSIRDGQTQTVAQKRPDQIKAVYVGSNAIYSGSIVTNVVRLLKNSEINAVVVDKKDDFGTEFTGDNFSKMVAPFREAKAFLICRIVALKFKDQKLSEKYYDLVLKRKSASVVPWRDDNGNYFFNPSLPKVHGFVKEIARRCKDDGCGECNFDYIRLPSDGNLKDILYPQFDPAGETLMQYRRRIMKDFVTDLAKDIRAHSPGMVYSADIFGYTALGREPGIGQYIEDFAEVGFGVYGMMYPSHWKCQEFGVHDPNQHPRLVYKKALSLQLRYLKAKNLASVHATPWIQGFDYANIYKCGPRVLYENNRQNFREQIGGIQEAVTAEEFSDLRLTEGWIVWHPGGRYPATNFLPR